MLAVLLAASNLACGSPAKAEAPLCEKVLREGKVVSTREVGQGISGAIRATLRLGDTELAAVFKRADISAPAFSFHGEKAPTFRDNWRHEVAAYELDQLLGLRLVPATVEREIGGRRGSLQAWADRPLTRFGRASLPVDAGLAENYLHAQRFFDYLIFNTDRHARNVVFGSDWRPVAIDQSITFHPLKRPYRPLYRFPRGPLEALERLDAQALRKRLGRHLVKEEIEGLLARRDLLLGLARTARAEGRADAFFDW